MPGIAHGNYFKRHDLKKVPANFFCRDTFCCYIETLCLWNGLGKEISLDPGNLTSFNDISNEGKISNETVLVKD
jgi:hypothetical protein